METIKIRELTEKIVDIVAEWEAHSMSSFSWLTKDIQELLEKELKDE